MKILYEGEWLNGEANGKGKEYNRNGDFIFEGEYKNDERYFGIKKDYYDNGNLLFEGELIKGKKNGEGKEYYDNGELKYEGEYLNGNWNGEENENENEYDDDLY